MLVLLILLASSVAQAEKRVAPVIGNSAYKHAGVLAIPMNDAADVATILKLKGFLKGAGNHRASRGRSFAQLK